MKILLIDPFYNNGVVPPNYSLGEIEKYIVDTNVEIEVIDFVHKNKIENLDEFKKLENDFINKIVEKMGYKKENMYAFGDGDNDAEMFKVVGTSVAMGNASKIAKDNATFVTDTIDNDGLYRAVKKIGLI